MDGVPVGASFVPPPAKQRRCQQLAKGVDGNHKPIEHLSCSAVKLHVHNTVE